MVDLLFGSGPQVWPSTQVSPLGPLPAFMPNRVTIQGVATDPPPAMSTNWPQAVSPPTAPIPRAGAGTPDWGGITAQALLAIVAMRRGQPAGPANDQDVEDFIYDALDLLPGANDVEVRCENGRATLTGSVPHKRLKRDIGEVVWTIPSVNDVQNNVTITARRRSRAGRETEAAAPQSGRKPA